MIKSPKKEKKEEIEEYVKEEDFNLSAISEQAKKRNDWKGELINFLNGRYFIPFIIIFIAIISFSLGRLSVLQERRPPVRILNNSSLNHPYFKKETQNTPSIHSIQQTAVVGASPSINSTNSLQTNSGQVVASKNGAKYHYPWCSGAKRISPKNLITFNSIKEARASGYLPAANCKGLK